MVMDIADKAIELKDGGNRCPTIPELFSVLNGQTPKSWNTASRLIRSVRIELEVRGEPVCSVSEVIYQRQNGNARKSFLERQPRSNKDARKCLPTGKGKRVAGLYFPRRNDLIYKMWLLTFTEGSMKGMERLMERIDTGVEGNLLSKKTVKELRDLCAARSKTKPDVYAHFAVGLLDKVYGLIEEVSKTRKAVEAK